MKQLGQTAKQILSPNFPIHRHNLDLIAFPYHCCTGRIRSTKYQGNIKMGTGLEHAAGEYARPVADVNRSGHRQTRGFFQSLVKMPMVIESVVPMAWCTYVR